MSNVAQETHQEFWRPPSLASADPVLFTDSLPTMAEACTRCRTEFLLGSGFCHSCGARRPKVIRTGRVDAAALGGLWKQGAARFSSFCGGYAGAKFWNPARFPSWMRYFQFHEIKNWVGLPTASLIAFVMGVGCVAGALLVGLLTARNFVDWQAIQFYRGEWLLAATASFVAGILLKKPGKDDGN
jgi:hypothetical protein